MAARYIFVDCEQHEGKASPATGRLSEFGAVDLKTKLTFHGHDDSEQTLKEFSIWVQVMAEDDRPVFVSDNPAYDWQWINFCMDKYGIKNPFGHSARRISDFYAGLKGDWKNTQGWKRFRKTPHDHNPVNDAMGNVEAFERIINGEL